MINPNTEFVVVNAFAERPFGGNPAAVFTNASGIDSDTMQAIARQMNLVETVFVLPGNDDFDFQFRYFTPSAEIPVAGHPSIAAWLGLSYKRVIDVGQRVSYRQGNLAGTQEIEFDCTEPERPVVKMKQPQPRFLDSEIDVEQVADVFALGVDDIRTEFPIRAIDTGLGHIIVPLRSIDSLFRVKRQIEPLRQLCQSAGVREAQLFCFDAQDKSLDLHTRNLCPREGIEDPACGVGNGALAAYISRYCWPSKPEIDLKIEQGIVAEMPSVIHTRTIKKADVLDVYIGGHGAVMIEGNFLF